MPFGREELDYIAALDAKADVEMLRREVPSLREESLRLLEVSTTLLQACAAAGLSLAEIATVVTRPLIGMDEEPSELERLCFAARTEVDAFADELTDLDEDEEEEEEEGEGGQQVEGGAGGHHSAGPLCAGSPTSPTFSSSSADEGSDTSHFRVRRRAGGVGGLQHVSLPSWLWVGV